MKKIKNNGACVLDTVLGFLDSSDTQVSYSFSFLFSSFFFFPKSVSQFLRLHSFLFFFLSSSFSSFSLYLGT